MSAITIGPVTGGRQGRPFGAAAFDLDDYGYVEEEFFIDGVARRFDYAPGTQRTRDGRWSVTPVSEAPYRTRILVRRPRDSSRFNGTVVLMWNNVSIGYEILTGETDALYEDGFAFVGAGVQHIGVHGYPQGDNRGLVAWDPERYGSLSVPDDGLAFDIYSQIAQLVGPRRSTGGPDPLDGLPVARVLALGVSQSATYLATYLNAIQPLEPVFDGFLLDVYFGNGAVLQPGDRPRSVARADEIGAAVLLMPPGSHLLRDDLAVPIFVVNSETESALYRPVRQPDTERFRLWEVAGVADGSDRISDVIPSSWPRDLGVVGHPLAPSGPNNVLTLDSVRAAALTHMQRWLAEGTPPPIMPRIEYTGEPPVIARDELGIARGGVRLPDVDVPLATHKGVAIDGSLALFGSSVAFPDDVVRRRYPDEDSYAQQRHDAVQRAVAAGVMLPRDAVRLLAATSSA